MRVDSLDGMLRGGIEHILDRGERVSSTRGDSREVRGAVFQLTNPRARVSRSAQRGQFFGALGEFSWYLAGSADLDHVSYYIPPYRKFVGDGTGSYGPRLFGSPSRIDRVIDILRRKPTSRQAVIQLFDNDDLKNNSLDVPCTCTLQFLLRNDAVEMITHMRSNDVMLGMPFDVFSFTMIQELVARSLDKELGTYTHMVGSLHLYTKNELDARNYLAEGIMAGMAMPHMPSGDPQPHVNAFLATEEAYRLGSATPNLDNGYWRDLAANLAAYRASKNGDTTEVRSIRDRLAGTVYDIYLNDLHWKM